MALNYLIRLIMALNHLIRRLTYYVKFANFNLAVQITVKKVRRYE